MNNKKHPAIKKLFCVNENIQFKIKNEEDLEPVHTESKTISENTKLQKKYEELVEKYDAALKKLAKI